MHEMEWGSGEGGVRLRKRLSMGFPKDTAGAMSLEVR